MRQLAALLLTLLLTACGAPNAPKADKPDTPSESPSASPAMAEPNVGDNALKVGEWREGSGVRTQVIEVVQPSDAKLPDFLGSKDADAIGPLVKVRACARASVTKPMYVSADEWFAYDAEGGEYTVSTSQWDNWPPLPQYPWQGRKLRPGQCVQGWVLLLAPRDTKIEKVSLGAGNETAAEWLIP